MDLIRIDHSQSSRAAILAEAFTSTGERSPHTRAGYRLDLTGCSYPLGHCAHPDPHRDHQRTAWLPWCDDHGVDPLGHVRPAYVLAWLADLGGSEPSRARRLAAVSSWYRYLAREEVVDRNPVMLHTGERPKTSAQLNDMSPTPVLSAKQVDAILAAADRDNNPAAAPLIALLAITGARISEIIDANEDAITTHQEHPVLTVTGKGRRQRVLPLTPSVHERLRHQLDARTDHPGRLPALAAGARQPRPLIAGRNGRRLARQSVIPLIRRLAYAAGLGETAEAITPHCFRHSYATDLLAAGTPVRDVQYALGHADPRTTERYDHSRLDLDRHPTYRRASQLHSALPSG